MADVAIGRSQTFRLRQGRRFCRISEILAKPVHDRSLEESPGLVDALAKQRLTSVAEAQCSGVECKTEQLLFYRAPLQPYDTDMVFEGDDEQLDGLHLTSNDAVVKEEGL